LSEDFSEPQPAAEDVEVAVKAAAEVTAADEPSMRSRLNLSWPQPANAMSTTAPRS
jgi:hypothetical protein